MDHRGVDVISDVLPFGRLWYGEPNAISNAINYAKFNSGSHDAVIRVYDEAGNVIETREQAGDFKRVVNFLLEVLTRMLNCADLSVRELHELARSTCYQRITEKSRLICGPCGKATIPERTSS
jgi:hypothetical protein